MPTEIVTESVSRKRIVGAWGDIARLDRNVCSDVVQEGSRVPIICQWKENKDAMFLRKLNNGVQLLQTIGASINSGCTVGN